MDPLALVTAALAFADTCVKARMQWWASLSPETQNRLADSQAQWEINSLAFFNGIIQPLIALIPKPPGA